MDGDIDTLEVLLNQSLIKSKVPIYSTGVSRFGTPAIVPIETPSGSNMEERTQGDDLGTTQQTMQLSERQDMLLGQACKVYYYASLSLDDIFDQVPQQNQICLITAMMLLTQKTNSEIASLIVQDEPWDPLTMFQRWILRTRVSGSDTFGLDLGDAKYHAEALQDKLSALVNVTASPRIQCLQCQISSELGQFYCWSGQYDVAIKYLCQCQEVHGQHSTSLTSDSRCHLDLVRISALVKLARLAVGEPLDSVEENLLNRVKALERNEQHENLADEFLLDNKARKLPYAWRQCALQTVLRRGDLGNSAILAVTNALYRLGEPCEMMLAIPPQVLRFLRTIVFEGEQEADAYFCSSIFEDLMTVIADAEARTSDGGVRRQIKGFVSKFCAAVGHVLCYDAAWKIGLLEPTPSDWSRIWLTYSCILIREPSFGVSTGVPDEMDEDEALAQALELMDPDDIERYLLSRELPPLTCCLTMLALSAQASDRNQFLERVRYLQSAARFLKLQEAKYLVVFKQIEFKLQEFTAMSQLGILAMEHEERREARIIARLEQKIIASNRVQLSEQADRNENSMEVDGETQHVKQESAGGVDEEHAKEHEKTREICELLKQFLENYGFLEQELQLRCLAICINGKQWEFVSGYCRNAVAVIDRNVHPEIFQVYSILVPLAEIMSISQVQGVDLKDITSASCFEALLSSNDDTLNILKIASLDLIRGLLPIAARPPPPSQQPTFSGGGGRWRQGSVQYDAHSQLGIKQEEDVTMAESQDHGHAAILRLFGMVRLRGIVDVFGALVAGALTTVLPEREKLTLSEFGYHALLTTAMDSVSSWMNQRPDSFARLNNGDEGRAIRGVPGATVRFTRLLAQLYERQVQFETNTLTTKLKVESEARAKSLTVDQPRLGSGSTVTPLFSTKAAASLVRYSLCLTDIYYLEGKYQDALASFLNASLMCTKGFTDIDRLKRRIWCAYNNGASSSSIVTPIPQTILPSQGGPLMSAETLGAQPFQSLASLSTAGINPSNGHPPGAVGLGLSAPSPMDVNGINGFFGKPGFIPVTPVVPTQQQGPVSVVPSNFPGLPSTPSTFARRAIESCMQLNEALSSVLMHQFLPRTDNYIQAFADIRAAREKGLLNFAGALPAVSSRPIPMPPLSNLSMAPGSTLTPSIPPPSGPHIPGAGGGYQFSPNGTPLIGSLTASTVSATASPRVHSSTLIFNPESKKAAEDKMARRGSLLPVASRRDGALFGQTFSPQHFLDLVVDVTMLEVICNIYKENRDEEGLARVQTRISSNRLALDLKQPSRDDVQILAQQDFLTRLWSRYARVA
ncbi:hypothetical protein BGX28_008972 [Mortierella sp. GBA30]|nr:hypothetical protein BGX28_008972 [Mortierella sp. GBA30]